MFIYVMDIESRDKLVSLGYRLLKGNDTDTVWVFENKMQKQFDNLDIHCVVSDVLTF